MQQMRFGTTAVVSAGAMLILLAVLTSCSANPGMVAHGAVAGGEAGGSDEHSISTESGHDGPEWLVFRIRVPISCDTAENTESGFLVPYPGRSVDPDWLFTHGRYFTGVLALGWMVKDIDPLSLATRDLDPFTESLPAYLIEYGAMPEEWPSFDPAEWDRKPTVIAVKGVEIHRFAGQNATDAAIVSSGVAWCPSAALVLGWSHYVRSLDELRAILDPVLAEAVENGARVTVMSSHLGAASDSGCRLRVFSRFDPRGPITTWLNLSPAVSIFCPVGTIPNWSDGSEAIVPLR